MSTAPPADRAPGSPSEPSSLRTPPREHWVHLSTGLRYHVLEWPAHPANGGGAAPPGGHTVLLLHGFLDFAWSWQRVAGARGAPGGVEAETPHLGPFRLLAPDLRGHGDSDAVGPGGYYHFLDYLADVHELIGKLAPPGGGEGAGAGRLSIVGHSMGGSVAAYFAGAFPELVHRLVLLEGLGPPEDQVEVPERVRTWVGAWRRARGGRGAGYEDFPAAAARLRAHDPLLDEEQALWLARRGAAQGEDGRVRFKHDPLHVTPGPLPFRRDLAASFWRRVRCPVLLVEGERSLFRLGEEDLAWRCAQFAHRERALLPGAGHMMQRHQPEALAALLAEFLLR